MIDRRTLGPISRLGTSVWCAGCNAAYAKNSVRTIRIFESDVLVVLSYTYEYCIYIYTAELVKSKDAASQPFQPLLINRNTMNPTNNIPFVPLGTTPTII